MDAYDRFTNLGKKFLQILLPSMVEAENFSDHPRKTQSVDLLTWLTAGQKFCSLT